MRAEFKAKTRKERLKHSGYRCEAEGDWYGLPAGQRCTADLALGVEYDHLILDANSKDNSFENCRAVCPKCHKWKSANRDTPIAAKTVRQTFMGLKTKPKKRLSGPGFPKPERSPKIDKSVLPPLPRANIYRREA